MAEEENSSWLSSQKLFASQVGSGLVALGAGVGTAFGCVPCLAIAVSAGTAATGLAVAEAQINQNKTNLYQGLSSVDLASQEEMLESLTKSRSGW